MSNVTKEQWVEVFKDCGLTDKKMQKWHSCFEKKYPEGHENFLQWLGLNKNEIREIRSNSL